MACRPKLQYLRMAPATKERVRAQVADHINAEVVSGTIASKQDAMGYFTWTFYYRRLLVNPSYYDLPGTTPEDISLFLSALVERVITSLQVGVLKVKLQCECKSRRVQDESDRQLLRCAQR